MIQKTTGVSVSKSMLHMHLFFMHRLAGPIYACDSDTTKASHPGGHKQPLVSRILSRLSLLSGFYRFSFRGTRLVTRFWVFPLGYLPLATAKVIQVQIRRVPKATSRDQISMRKKCPARTISKVPESNWTNCPARIKLQMNTNVVLKLRTSS